MSRHAVSLLVACLATLGIALFVSRDALAQNGTWSQIQGTGPSKRSGHAGCYDTQGKRLIVFGGEDSTGLRKDLWALSLGCTPAWTLLDSGSGPEDRRDHTIIYDRIRNQVVLFGGEREEDEEEEVLGDLWAYNLATMTWTELTDSTTGPYPCAREGHTAVYSPSGSMSIYAGAVVIPGGVYYTNDTFILNLATRVWNRAEMSGGSPPCYNASNCTLTNPDDCDGYPPAQWYHAAIWDPDNGRMIIHGGTYEGTCPTGITWAKGGQCSGPQGWCELFEDNGPSPKLENHRATYDSRRHRMLTFGGDSCLYGGSDTTAVLWQMNTIDSPVWTKLTPSGGPGKRSYSAAVYDSASDRVVIFGGETGTTGRYGDTWQLSFDTTAPATTSDLNIVSISSGVKFKWTAPGDDGSSGCKADSYEIRKRSGSEITASNWSSSTLVTSPLPSGPTTPGAGVKDSITISLSSGVYWYVALKTKDWEGNVSGVSNNACIMLGNPPDYCDGGFSAVSPREEAALTHALAIVALYPNPAREGTVEVSFTLADDSPAALKVFDLAGRFVEAQDLVHLGPGTHVTTIGGRTKLPPGHYKTRISQAGHSVTRSVVVIR